MLLMPSGVAQKKIDHGFFSRDDRMSLFSISKDTGSFWHNLLKIFPYIFKIVEIGDYR